MMSLPFSDPVLIFATVMTLILLAPMAARKIGLPEIVGLIIAGIVMGPHGFGILERDDTIKLLGAVGLLYLMFLAGLEIDLFQVKKNKMHTVFFGFLTFAIPLSMGIALGVFVLGMTIPVSVLLASMFSSHTLVTFPVVGKLGLTKTRVVTTGVGGTIITDILALLILAVIAASTRGALDTVFWIRTIVLMIAYAASVIIFLPRISRFFFRKMASDDITVFIFVLAAAFICSYLAHLAGLEPIIGAFLAGLMLNSLIPEKSLLMTRVHFTGEVLFIPFFLISVGMLVDFSLMFKGWDAWIISGGMIGVAVTAKLIAAWIAGNALRYDKREWPVLFGLTVNQAAATLAAVLVGYNLGLFSEAVITGTILMIAVTCLTGSLITDKAGRKLALHLEGSSFRPSAAPPRILIPIEKREGAKELLDIALLLRDKTGNEPLYPLHVVPDDKDLDEKMEAAEKVIAHSIVRALSVGAVVIPLTKVAVNIASGISAAIKENRISLVVMGWGDKHIFRTRSFGRIINNAVQQSPRFFMVNKVMRQPGTLKRILFILPPRGERHPGFETAVTTVKTLANQIGTTLLVLGTTATMQNAESFLRKAAPSVPVTRKTYENWKTVPEFLLGEALPTDWLIIMSARKGSLIWQPSLDKIPGITAHAFVDHNLSVLFPPSIMKEQEPLSTEGASSSLPEIFDPKRILLQLATADTGKVLETLLGTYFGENNKVTSELSAYLYWMCQAEPVELVEGAVLLHHYVPHVPDSTVFLAVSKKPFNITQTEGKTNILIVLLDPVKQDPEKHLKALAAIAKVFRLPEIVKKLMDAENFTDFTRALEETEE
jgi:Kef-type K+ transport system membrane component KefB/mannitol/fructose-specific phosphotransferase system IIA component (Ntr-type)